MNVYSLLLIGAGVGLGVLIVIAHVLGAYYSTKKEGAEQ